MSDALMAPRKKRNEFGMAIAKSILEYYHNIPFQCELLLNFHKLILEARAST